MRGDWILVGNIREIDLVVDWRIILKWMFKE